jgi:hypothetical protein
MARFLKWFVRQPPRKAQASRGPRHGPLVPGGRLAAVREDACLPWERERRRRPGIVVVGRAASVRVPRDPLLRMRWCRWRYAETGAGPRRAFAFVSARIGAQARIGSCEFGPTPHVSRRARSWSPLGDVVAVVGWVAAERPAVERCATCLAGFAAVVEAAVDLWRTTDRGARLAALGGAADRTVRTGLTGLARCINAMLPLWTAGRPAEPVGRTAAGRGAGFPVPAAHQPVPSWAARGERRAAYGTALVVGRIAAPPIVAGAMAARDAREGRTAASDRSSPSRHGGAPS